MLVLAACCVGAGTFELHRYHAKERDNQRLEDNAVAPVTPLTTRMVPLTGRGQAPDALDIRYRTVGVTGRYLPSVQTYLDDQRRHGHQGFFVLTPLATGDGVLLVARGFVSADAEGHRPAHVAAPPSGTVHLTGRLQTASTSGDRLGALGRGEITTVNPASQARRLGRPVAQAYVNLDARQPGAAGLQTLPDPPTSNPTGGASEWQLLSYVVQWWVFALLALLAPFAFCRAEVREARRRFLGLEDVGEFDLMLDDAVPALDGGESPAGELAVRAPGSVVRRADVPVEQWERASRLAERYGRSLGPDDGRPLLARRGRRTVAAAPVRRSADQPHRSEGDDYHGDYNDYLWQLALRDGDLPAGPPPVPAPRPALDAQPDPGTAPRVIDHDGDR